MKQAKTVIIDDPGANVSKEQQKSGVPLISHDLQAALADVLGGLQLIDLDRLDEKTRLQVERSKASSVTLSRLLGELVDGLNGFSDDSMTRVQNVYLSKLLQGLKQRWSGYASEKGIRFEIERDPNVPAVLSIDGIALERVLSNLLGNAVKFTDEGIVKLKLSCNEVSQLTFSVCDTGPGFSELAISTLFMKYGRPTDSLKPGSGLGLHIAKQLTDLMKGKIAVVEQSQAGARVDLVFPKEAWYSSTKSEGNAYNEAIDDPVDLSGCRILLAEDNSTNQLVATQMLALMGARTVVAADGIEAMDLLEDQEFDIALLDIEMPRMSGLELIKAIRLRKDDKAQMPLIALTAYVMREHRERILAAGATGIIAKPLMSIEEFGNAILELSSGAGFEPASQFGTKKTSSAEPDRVVDPHIYKGLENSIGPGAFTELLGKLVDDLQTVRSGLIKGRDRPDAQLIRANTHVLTSVAGAIGAVPLQKKAESLNTLANREEASSLGENCDKCLTGLDQLISFIENERETTAR